MDQKGIWSDLSENARARILNSSRLLEFKRGDHVYRAGDVSRGLYFVEQGLVGLNLIGLSGKEHLMRFFRGGQFFGHRALFTDEPYHASAIVLEPTRLRFVGKPDILAVLETEPRGYKSVVRVLAQELRRCELQHVAILENQILSRTALALVYLKDLHAEHNWTRQEIASFCASTTSTVIKALAELENLGLIRQDGRSIDILNRDGLIALQEQEM